MSVLVSEESRTTTRRTYLWSLAAVLPLIGAGAWLWPTFSAKSCCDSVCPLCATEAKAKKSCCDSVCPLCATEAKAKKSCCDSVCPLCATEAKAKKSGGESKPAAKSACCDDE